LEHAKTIRFPEVLVRTKAPLKRAQSRRFATTGHFRHDSILQNSLMTPNAADKIKPVLRCGPVSGISQA
jgi:hypothetical protein